MRSLIRDELCVDQPINLKKLSPFMKIYAGIIVRVHESKYYKNKLNARIEERYLEQTRKDEMVKDCILAMIYRELNNNKSLEDKGDVCASVILSVSSRYSDSLQRIITHKDFLSYDVEIVDENQDMRQAFPSMPVLLQVKKREV